MLTSLPRTAVNGSRSLLPLHIVFVSLFVLASYSALSLQLYELDSSHAPIALSCGLSVIGLIAYARYALQLPWLSASVVYLLVFWVFHYGLAFTAVVVPEVLDWQPYENWRSAWLFWPNVRITMLLGVLGAAGFVFAVGFFSRRPVLEARHEAAATHDDALYRVGWLIMIAGLSGSMRAIAQGGGVGVFSLAYGDLRNAVLGPLQMSLDLSSLGCLFALCGAAGRRWIAPLVLWTAFGAVFLLLGLRSEALIPLLSFVIALKYRGVHFHRGLLIAALLLSLVAIPAIKTFRVVGFANRAEVAWTEVSPLWTLAELGGTLRAAKAYVDWIEDGDELLLGTSYWAPLDRQLLTRVLPGRQPIPISEDKRVPQRNIGREGAVGLSAMGEAYYNFGRLGPFIFFGCVGLLFGWLERRAVATPYGCALLGIVTLLSYYNIRDSWLPVPARASFAILVLGIIWLASQRFLRSAAELTGPTVSYGRGR